MGIMTSQKKGINDKEYHRQEPIFHRLLGTQKYTSLFFPSWFMKNKSLHRLCQLNKTEYINTVLSES